MFITGSDADEWITEERTRQTASVLSDMGADVEMHLYPGRPHEVSKQELSEAREFLQRRLGDS